MPAISGYLQVGLTYNGAGRNIDYQVDNPNLPAYIFAFSQDPGQGAGQADYGWSALTDTQPQQFLPAATLAGYESGASFATDWYERIHVNPPEIDFASLVAPESADIEVWNAYRESSKTLNAVNGTTVSGLTLTEPELAPTTFAPLEARTYVVTASPTGPPQIDGTYAWDFGAEDPECHITAQAVLAWSFQHNWVEPAVERISYRTQILTSYNGTEQRMRLRRAPRRSLSYQYLVSQIAQTLAHQRMRGWQMRLWGVPVWSDYEPVTSTLAVGTTVITIDTADKDYVVGGLVFLRRDDKTHELVKIATVNPTDIQLASPTRFQWSIGDLIMPARIARMEASQSLSAITSNVGTADVEFTLAATDELTAADPGTSYQTLTVFPYRPNWDQTRGVGYERKVEVMDNGIGPIFVEDQSGIAVETEGVRLLITDRADIEDLRQYVSARAGKLVPCWLPTFRSDVVPYATLLAGQTVWQVVAAEHAQFSGGPQRRDIQITMRDGTVHYRRITLVAATADPEVEELTLDSSFTADLIPSGVLLVSFMRVARLSTDTVEIARHTQGVATAELRFRSLVDDV